MVKEYPSNLNRDQFDLFSDLLPPAKPGGRPRTVDVYAVINAILYVLVEGVRCRALPGDFPPWQTVYMYFRNWRKDGTWQRIHDRLREWYRIEQGRQPSPSEAVIDSQSVKRAAGVNAAVGFDAGKQIKGRKRFLAVETLGLVMAIFVTAASTPERDGAKTLLPRVKALKPRSIQRLSPVCRGLQSQQSE
ncbi:IS5 family transposase [Halomicronema sp. CCY15110]|uniref:IS5 family transposase n=1 Tax=Halomicronema sp. CCY15110 TaxID=2767773 RepID=UPI001EF18AEE|nr:IS5 family transposase [Halomicronema sp. CCY15110]